MSSPLVRSLAAEVQGRYLVRVPRGPHLPLLVGFHGYGENAERHLEQLARIPGASDWLQCSVDALHPFYNSKTQEVVGSWMTRRDREAAIRDNTRYVARVVEAVQREFEPAPILVFAGFSQGVAMAYRAAAGSGHSSHGLIALAGDVPPELKEQDLPGFPPVLIGRGRSDEWYDASKLEADREFLSSRGILVETCIFDGGHEWTEAFFQAAGRFLQARL
jgi:predicted esterase